VDEVHILFRKAAIVEHSDPLFKNHTAAHVRLNSRSVSHIKGPHKLKYRDFNREIKRTDNTNRSKWPSETLRELTSMISRVGETSGKEANLISTEVFEEINSN
jgi:hypothetical protein